jgi:hypothetical protein
LGSAHRRNICEEDKERSERARALHVDDLIPAGESIPSATAELCSARGSACCSSSSTAPSSAPLARKVVGSCRRRTSAVSDTSQTRNMPSRNTFVNVFATAIKDRAP